MTFRHPGELRNALADLLQMSEKDRKNLDRISITQLVDDLINYTIDLETELKAKKEKKKIIRAL